MSAEFYDANWYDRGHQIINPIGCQDCHDPKTINLQNYSPGAS
ncbi:MAG: ammonia-forming cytochrome c nitrite reductase subunit c552 [Melioribacteraceae bacterium]|nr:ammonia-forming cytochrome c nitrite reductase subunit c552 [Melioribacteraceae bacterium]